MIQLPHPHVTLTLTCHHHVTGTHQRQRRPYISAWCPRCRQHRTIKQTHHWNGTRKAA